MRCILAFLVLAGCAPFPALQGNISDSARNAPYPVLTPLPPLPEPTDDEAAVMQQRIADLQARAARIREIDIAALQ